MPRPLGDCYVCDRGGRQVPAVASCGNCSVGLCRQHLDQELLAIGPGGLRYGCSHEPDRWAHVEAAPAAVTTIKEER